MTSGKQLCLFAGLIVMAGCGGSGGDSQQAAAATTPLLQAGRILGLDVKQVPSVTYALAYQQALDFGAREVSLSLDWVSLEPTTGNYDDSLPDTIESFYPFQDGDLTLVLRPLDTPGPRLPSDLAGLAFDDPAVISAFADFLDHLHGRMPNLNASGKIKWIHVGNEIGAALGSDVSSWNRWRVFFNAAKMKIESLWGADVVVSSIVQFGLLRDPGQRAAYLSLLPELDVAALTYYPLNADFSVLPVSVVAADFDFMASSIPGKPILLQECGYPTSTVNLSDEAAQADFVSAVFRAWDRHHQRIELIDFAWQYDVSEATVDQWVIDYGMAGHSAENAFKHYLWSLGLGNYDSSEKLALQRMRDELQARDWQS